MNRLIALSLLAPMLAACTTTQQDAAVDIARQTTVNVGKYVQEPRPSAIFPPDNVKWQPLEIGKGEVVTARGKRMWLVELRGWLTGVGSSCNEVDPDWGYELEPDVEWADSAGMPLVELLRAGNLVQHVFGEQTGDSRMRTVVGVPQVAVELNGYLENRDGAPAPNGWRLYGQNCVTKSSGVALWGFNPQNPLDWQPPLKSGDYVRMYGSLVTDEPHDASDWKDLILCRQFNDPTACKAPAIEAELNQKRWGGNRGPFDPANQARWTEMHPPDIIAILPPKDRKVALRSVAVSAENCLVGPCEKTTLDVDLAPPDPKPANAIGVEYVEQVSPATNYATIVEGHSSGPNRFDGARVFNKPDSIRVHVAVQGQPGYGSHGRFAAIYRIRWVTQ